MSKHAVSVAAALLALALVGARPVVSQQDEIRDFLARAAGFTAEDFAALDAGQVVTRSLDTGAKTEMALIGAVRIQATRQRFMDYFEDIASFEDGEFVLRAGQFSDPPVVSDLARFGLTQEDMDDFRNCRPGTCGIKLGAVGAERMQQLDWNDPGVAVEVDATVRQGVVEYVSDYLARGDGALMTYDDRSKPVSLAEQWRGILDSSPHFFAYNPPLAQYLRDFPHADLPGSRQFVFWAQQRFQLKPTLVLTHVVLQGDDPARPGRSLMAQKQIYASHYFEGSLALTAGVDDPEATAERPAIYAIYSNRSRGDLLGGLFGGLTKSVIAGQARDGLALTLKYTKEGLEAVVQQ